MSLEIESREGPFIHTPEHIATVFSERIPQGNPWSKEAIKEKFPGTPEENIEQLIFKEELIDVARVISIGELELSPDQKRFILKSRAELTLKEIITHLEYFEEFGAWILPSYSRDMPSKKADTTDENYYQRALDRIGAIRGLIDMIYLTEEVVTNLQRSI